MFTGARTMDRARTSGRSAHRYPARLRFNPVSRTEGNITIDIQGGSTESSKGTSMKRLKNTAFVAADVRFGILMAASIMLLRDQGQRKAKASSCGRINRPPFAHRLRWMISDPKSGGVAL